MNHSFRLLLIALALGILSSCAPITKGQYLAQHQDFMAEVERNHEDFSEEDWKQRNEELNKSLEEYYPKFKEELSTEEKVQIWGDVVAYHLIQSGDRAAEHWAAHEEEYIQLLEENAEFLEESGRIFQEEVLPEIKAILPELKELGEEFLEKLEERGTLDRLEEAIENWADSVNVEFEVEEDSASQMKY